MATRIFVGALLVLFVGSTGAEERRFLKGEEGSTYLFRLWTKHSGMPHLTVNAIAESNEGFLWLGTFDGLARFDGLNFKRFGLTDGLVSNRVTSLHVDATGDLWVGHELEGLSRFDGDVFHTYLVADGLPGGTIWAIEEGSDGTLYVGTDTGLATFHRGTQTFRSMGDSGAQIQALLTDRQGGLWAAGAGKLWHRGPGEKQLEAIDASATKHFALLEDPLGKIWLATSKGLVRIGINGKRQLVVEAGCPPRSGASRAGLIQDNDGNLWFRPCAANLQSSDTHLYRLDASVLGHDKPIPERLVLRGIPTTSALLSSGQGEGLWFGTHGHGLGALLPRNIEHWNPAEELGFQELRSMVADGSGGLWIGADCGAPLIHFRDNVFSTVKTDPSGERLVCIGGLARGKEGDLWVGSEGFLVRIPAISTGPSADPSAEAAAKTQRRLLVDHKHALKIYSILETDDEVWVGLAGHGLARLDNRNGDITRADLTYYTIEHGLAGDHVHALHMDRSGDLWIGTHKGLSRLRDGSIETFSEDAAGMIRVIHEDGQGVLWIGTYGGGLIRYANDRFTRFTTEHGLYDNVVSHLIEDQRGRFWMLGNRGLFYHPREQLEAYAADRIDRLTSVFFDQADGVAEGSGGRQPAGWQMEDGRLFFPTVEGLLMVDPERIAAKSRIPRVLIDRVLVEGRPVDPSGIIELSHKERDLEIHYTAPGSFDADKFRFRYRLEGFDEAWDEVGERRTAYYTGLPPGEYTFRVDVANRYGSRSEQTASLNLLIHPPWWLSRWAYAAYLLAVLSLIFVYIRRQHRRIEQGEELLAARTEEVQRLGELLPICASCKKIRDDKGYWEQLEVYFSDRTELSFSHGICPTCAEAVLEDLAKHPPQP